MNHLYFGDCLDVLKQLKEENPQPFIDLIYIDPPFNSKRNYNILFESIDMKDANAQKQAFADTWSNYTYMDELNQLADLHKDLYVLLKTFHELKSISDSAVAYLTTMSLRIYYMHRLLKPTGSFYLHCDPTMSHYLKLVCDMIFGEKNFHNDIIWKRTAAHSSSIKYGPVHDDILFYSKSENFTWNKLYQPYDEEYIETFFDEVDENGKRYQRLDLTGAGTTKGESGMPWRSIDVTKKGRHWAYTHQQLEEWDKENKIHWPKKAGGVPRLKIYPEDKKGVVLQDIWTDIKPLHNLAAERLGFPTQKPTTLLERIISASSNESNVVADFFCGCGTTIAAAQKLNRKWIGCDISHLAIRLIKKRLVETYGKGIEHNIKIHGMPKDVAGAKELAQNIEGGRIGFQDWVIEVMLNGVVNEKKVADGGYDGYITFNIGKEKYFALIECKSGKLTVKNMREFVQVIKNQHAAVGIFVCFESNVTKEMTKEARDAGHIKVGNAEFPMDKIQIITIEDLFHGKQPQLPGAAENTTFKKAQRNEEKSVSKGLFD